MVQRVANEAGEASTLPHPAAVVENVAQVLEAGTEIVVAGHEVQDRMEAVTEALVTGIDAAVAGIEDAMVGTQESAATTAIIAAPSTGIWFSPQARQPPAPEEEELHVTQSYAPSIVGCPLPAKEVQRSPSAVQLRRDEEETQHHPSLSLEELEGGGVMSIKTQVEKSPAQNRSGPESGEDSPLARCEHGGDSGRGATDEGWGHWPVRPATAPATVRISRVFNTLAKKLQFEDLEQDHAAQLPALMTTPSGEVIEEREDEGGNSFSTSGGNRVGPGQEETLDAAAGTGTHQNGVQIQVHISPLSISTAEEREQAHGLALDAAGWTTTPGPRSGGGTGLISECQIVYKRRYTMRSQHVISDEEAQQVGDFINSISATPQPSIMGSRPPATAPVQKGRRRNVIPPDFQPWRSQRLQNQGNGARKHVISKAQRVTMKKMGVTEEEDQIDDDSIKRYLGLFDHPLSPQHVEALAELLDVDIAQNNGSTDVLALGSPLSSQMAIASPA